MTQIWQKSSYCSEGDACLNLASGPNRIHLRESDTPRTTLTLTPRHLAALIRALKAGSLR
ncbi:DUF397 domain-containing protein [Streptomyces sp. NPDC046215]|uniref:DUF397 domain-containing protein n=1 Tax=Streptomyces stramineus TaxID=173861 RepID=A0ABN1A2X1_9ACTN